VSEATWIAIEDPADSRLDPYRGLRDVDARRRLESHHGFFVAEGVTVIRRLLSSAYPVLSVLALPAKAARLSADLNHRGVAVYVADRAVLAGVAGFDVHRGALAIAARRPPRSFDTVVAGANTVAVLEGLTDHENLGAIVRSASALGVGALLLDPTCADPLYRRSVRVSMGEVLFLPWARLDTWPDALHSLRDAGFTLVALTPSSDAEAIDDVLGSVKGPVAFLLGSEGPGLSAVALAAADRIARVPIAPSVDSLNVGHAAAIAFHAARRRAHRDRSGDLTSTPADREEHPTNTNQ
jgi:tRNA G18 (ribose-2'-O)-methylase SpoU